MNMHVWGGQQEAIAHGCFVLNFTITEMEGGIAKGSITAIDYAEGGISFTESWEAHHDKGVDKWVAKRQDDDEAIWKDDKGEAHFTLNNAVNLSMKNFIDKHIKLFFKSEYKVITPYKYGGEIKEYVGTCVCEKLQISNRNQPFPWHDLTGEKFPYRCFACSCGKRWWEYDQINHSWARVGDDRAWLLLMEHDGEDVEPIACLDTTKGFEHLQTIRDRGIIPL